MLRDVAVFCGRAHPLRCLLAVYCLVTKGRRIDGWYNRDCSLHRISTINDELETKYQCDLIPFMKPASTLLFW